MLADAADSYKIPGKGGEHESKAKACFPHTKNRQRLGKLLEALISIEIELVCMQGKGRKHFYSNSTEVTHAEENQSGVSYC